MEAWTIVLVLAALIGTIPVAIDIARNVHGAASAAIEVEAATRHPVEAETLGASHSRSDGSEISRWVHVRWFDGRSTRDDDVEVAEPVKPGQRLPIWVDENGEITSAPRTAVDARADGVAAGLMLWLTVAALAGGGLRLLRRLLDRYRYRSWERDLQVLVENGGELQS
ncbi:hypothetical protein DVS77_04790 [Mycolicibacterium moriokaense]|nr:hypothetical protein DVS77_04790 [Mycolicibacterium moriokaense]